MKTTIEISDELIGQVRRVAQQEGASLRALVEEGLQRSLEARLQAVRQRLDFPVDGGSGATHEFRDASRGRIRDEICREPGA